MKKNYNIIKKIFSKDFKSIYITIFLILIIRCFILEPFRIPSGSMQPTILVGDFIFTNKFIYGIKIPIINKKIHINTPEYGDIIVFKKDKNYIKRIIALTGDKVIYKNKNIYINNKLIKNKYKGSAIKIKKNQIIFKKIYKKEYLNPKKEYYIKIYKNIDNSKYTYDNITVPDSSYFVLGDNRDNSDDSRYWGFVKNENLLGKAIFIWMSIDYKIIDIRWNRFLTRLN